MHTTRLLKQSIEFERIKAENIAMKEALSKAPAVRADKKYAFVKGEIDQLMSRLLPSLDMKNVNDKEIIDHLVKAFDVADFVYGIECDNRNDKR
jgi:hypothetical protein